MCLKFPTTTLRYERIPTIRATGVARCSDHCVKKCCNPAGKRVVAGVVVEITMRNALSEPSRGERRKPQLQHRMLRSVGQSETYFTSTNVTQRSRLVVLVERCALQCWNLIFLRQQKQRATTLTGACVCNYGSKLILSGDVRIVCRDVDAIVAAIALPL